jgi:predicted site-specific integrase-resolvase
MIWLNMKEYADLVGVTKQRVDFWVRTGRISAYKPKDGVVLIDKKTKRPEPLKKGGLSKTTA